MRRFIAYRSAMSSPSPWTISWTYVPFTDCWRSVSSKQLSQPQQPQSVNRRAGTHSTPRSPQTSLFVPPRHQRSIETILAAQPSPVSACRRSIEAVADNDRPHQNQKRHQHADDNVAGGHGLSLIARGELAARNDAPGRQSLPIRSFQMRSSSARCSCQAVRRRLLRRFLKAR